MQLFNLFLRMMSEWPFSSGSSLSSLDSPFPGVDQYVFFVNILFNVSFTIKKWNALRPSHIPQRVIPLLYPYIVAF